jgi:hypothetical protein
MSRRADVNAQSPAAGHTEDSVYRLMKHPLRHKILIRTGERPWCPTELAQDIGESLKRICEQVAVMVKHSPPCLELVEERPGPRGSTLHFYKALVRVTLLADDWLNLTPLDQGQQTVTITEQLFAEWSASINSGAFYGDPEHCLMRTAITVDRQGMKDISEMLIAVQARFAEVEREAAERRDCSGDKGIRVVTGLASFRAASD